MLVDFGKYYRKQEKIVMFEKILEHLKTGGKEGIDSPSQIKLLAKTILEETPYYRYKSATPVIRIAGELGIDTYSTDGLERNLSGVIYIGGTTKEIYGNDKIILVDESDPLKHQRFVIAHEVAHYLLDCLTDTEYSDGRILFSEGYPKYNHDSPKEVKADMFAAELLMPTDLFIEQYNIATEEKNNHMFTIMYLSDYFQTKMSSIEKRIIEVLQ